MPRDPLSELIHQIHAHAVLKQINARGQHQIQTILETSNPGGPSPIKDRYLAAGTKLAGYEHTEEWGTWEVNLPQWDEIALWTPAPTVSAEVAALAASWAENPPPRPGWTGSIAGPPLPIPAKPSPWETLPKGIITHPGAGGDGRIQVYKRDDYDRWFAVGEVHAPAPAYRGRPAPIPWSSPLADPLADMRAAGGGTVYGEHRQEDQ